MNFYVFIRSIGERTERLCLESVAQKIPKEKIIIIKNLKPSYRAYEKMFDLAKLYKCNWYLGLDADVVLKNNWYEIFLKKIKENSKIINNIFRIHFMVADKITGRTLSRGNNFYNGKYTDKCKEFMQENIQLSEDKNKKLNEDTKKYIMKPESSLEYHMKDKLGVDRLGFSDLIGWHGYEQSYKEIFRQYLVRHHRDQSFLEKYNMNFLSKKSQNHLLEINDIDRYVANLGWNSYEDFELNNIDASIYEKIGLSLDKNNIAEKETLNDSLADFYKKNYKFMKILERDNLFLNKMIRKISSYINHN